MSRNGEVERLIVFARDFAELYMRFSKHFISFDAISIESFAEVFDASKVEYLHYGGGTALDRPFFPAITDDLLQLSAAYLAIPAEVAPRIVRTFGLLLSLFVYATQPARQRDTREGAAEEEVTVETPLGAASAMYTAGTSSSTRPSSTGTALTENGNAEAAAPPLSSLSPRLPMRSVPISVSCMRHLLSCMSTAHAAAIPTSTLSQNPRDFHRSGSSSNNYNSRGAEPLAQPARSSSVSSPAPVAQLSYTEARALLMLHRAGGWHVEPYVHNGLHIDALMTAHAARGVPLVTRVTPLPPPTFAAMLTARSIMHASVSPAALGGADSLFRDPEFVRMRQEYEKERQQLFQ
ncbi:hypothetical protein ABB37_05208 [Leptomonas pyrrhocoris]|uniref:Uncharacterized protein n=1 Tax=Leptomonas pyrrhocoris TaxID=157538 RepID=A0A0N0DVE3_LEPPY|nr:hypothetical protein ABB37_05208 [Leptomonas pyrrhocoris]XP_015658678.1 hypothetical protein ABB37_05208 [Leptomonas pyrrhocoris]KPA80238.1 hypothetical protein ABB37_05208 [Leptomonas pyrrhocoris]KPA80239.1 hypothetical protein ABB37_05208 [Leptomonas pyrrhocoris]|eukprot:XP_015658677.1 hypothetical protein ABB37_05208 [Leptomonas pyrrhocoris]